ncbi:CD48 antigen isoform X1 [Camelus dromedarius]|uniref:CD48 antigen-like isoform X1 n=2 Tax=Camelus bactrianus TaxID=9837 RepID=A0A9W3ESI7_CAMBA|nr:CD48 antigen-like isoform X1 [Camelus bactrianus]XP_010994421.1 CD48 antigen isoform X1 [Camelus dromedarius]
MDSLCCSWSHIQSLVLQISLILALPSSGSQTVKDPSSSCTSKRTVGGSVQLQLNSALYPNIREIEWKWDSEDDKPQLLVSWKPDASSPDWYEFEEKYKHRFSLTRMASLSIRNLTMEMSGLYIANIKFRSGKSQEEAFRLCLYEPIPDPQIQIHSSSNTSGWCNISLECEIPGSTENLTVTWLSQGLPRELEQRGPLGPAPSSRNLSLSVPLSHFNGHLTCVVSNPVDEKNTSLHLEDICPWKGSFQSKWLWRGILPTVLMVILGAGVWIWMRKKMETRRGESTLLPVVPASAAAPQALPTEESADLQTGEANSHDPFYEESSLLRHPKKDTEKGTCHSLSPECPLAIYTVYEKIRTSPELQEDA